jgi:hypothetical protein
MGEEYLEEAAGDARGGDKKNRSLSGALWGDGAKSNEELEETIEAGSGCIKGTATVRG